MGAERFIARPATAIALVAFLALAVRLAAIAAAPDLPLAADPADYHRHAVSIAAGDGYPPTGVTPAGGPTAVRPPAFPYLLGGVYAVTGDSELAGRFLQALLGTALVLLTMVIALELFGRRTAVVVGALAAVFPPLVIDGITLLSEPLFVTLELLGVIAVLRFRRTDGIGWVGVAGVVVGLAFLTRANALALLVVLAFAVWDPRRRRSVGGLRAPALLVTSALLVVVPWTIRNAGEFDRFIPVSTQDGYTLAGTYNATSRDRAGLWITANADPAIGALLDRNGHLDEAELNAELRAAARRFALDNSGYVVEVAANNLPRLFNLGGTAYERDVARFDYGLGPGWAKLMTFSLIPFLVLAVAGAATQAARTAPRWIWALPLLLLTTVFVLAANRHRAAIDPFILLLGGLALVACYERLREARTRR